MKVIILAGGYGTRLGSLTEAIPKPMLKVGTIPIIHHIMNHFDRYGFNEFIIALGYKSWEIKNYFLNLNEISNDITIELKHKKITYHDSYKKNWKITLVETGIETMTGGRLKRLKHYLGDQAFMMTYGDGLANVNLKELLNYHTQNKKIGTITAVRPAARFGELEIKDNLVESFQEKPQAKVGWINGGFFIFEPNFLDLIDGDSTVLEESPLEKLSSLNELCAYKHSGFWRCVDTKRDLDYMNELWHKGHIYWEDYEKN